MFGPTTGPSAAEKPATLEAIEIVFDPEKVTFGTLLRIFFSVVHDPTPSRTGRVVTSARNIVPRIFNTDMMSSAKWPKEYVKQLDQAHVFPRQIVTQIVPLEHFSRARNITRIMR